MKAVDVIQSIAGDAALVTEIFKAAFEICYVGAVDAGGVVDSGAVAGQQHCGVDMSLAQFDEAGVAIANNGGHGLGVATQLGQGREEGLPPFRIPLGAVHIDIAPRPLNIHQVHRVRRENGDVDFEHPLTLTHLEVMEDKPSLGQVIP